MPRTAHRTCPLCEAMCGLTLTLQDDGTVSRVTGNRSDLFSKGYICPKGASLAAFDADPDRLTGPLVRGADGELHPASWDEAFARVAEGIAAARAEHGSDAVGLYTGNPVIHSLALPLYLGPLREALGSRHVYSTTTLDTAPMQAACGLMFGDPMAVPVPDVDRTELLVVLGANPVETHGSLWTAPGLPDRLKELRRRGGRLVVADPRRTRTAALADTWLPVRPGSDPWLLLGLLRLVAEAGVAPDRGPDAERLRGWEELRALLLSGPYAAEDVAGVCGVEPEAIRELAAQLLAADRAAVYGRLGTSTTRFGTLTSWLIQVLNAVTGNLDRPGGVMFGRPLHAMRRPTEPFTLGRWRSRVSGRAEVNGELPAAVLAEEALTPGPGRLAALVVAGGNPASAAPDTARTEAALRGLDFLVCVDPYVNETSRLADVVLPPPGYVRSAHYDVILQTRSVRAFARFSPAALPREDGTPSEGEILARLCGILQDPSAPVDGADVERRLLTTLVGGARARIEPLRRWSVEELVARLHDDGEALHRRLDAMIRLAPTGDAFGLRPGLNLATLAEAADGVDLGPLEPALEAVLLTADRRVDLAPEPLLDELDRLTAERKALGHGPGTDPADGKDGVVRLSLVSHRQLRGLNSWGHNVPALARGTTRCVVTLHPADAVRAGIGDDDLVEVRAARPDGPVITVPAQLVEDLTPGTAALPYGWGHDRPGMRTAVATGVAGAPANAVTSADDLDPLSGVPAFNAVDVLVSRVG